MLLRTPLLRSAAAGSTSRSSLVASFSSMATLASRPSVLSSRSSIQCLRYFATQKAGIDSNKITIKQTDNPRPKLPNDQLLFGHTFSDHMLKIQWSKSTGWENPTITPYGKLSFDPSAVVFHYGMECFEGMKAYKTADGEIRMFRPDMNMNRLYRSCERLALPTFDKTELLECIKQLLRLDHSWIPEQRGYSLYLRPTVIATQQTLGVGPSSEALLFVICSPVGPYYKTGFAAVRLLADPTYVRAWPGGTGDAKVGGNYAPGILPQIAANEKGYAQILWLFGPEHNVTEVGTMNFFMFWHNESGEKELLTPKLDGTILPGVTRDSILTLAKQWGEFKVTEGSLTMAQLRKAVQENRVIEAFGAGTAAIVSPIKEISYAGDILKIPLDPSDASSEAGPLTKRFADTIMGIQYGEIESEWSVRV